MSSKRMDFEKFARIVRDMNEGDHRTLGGFRELLDVALSMNGGGRFRQVRWKELLCAVGDQPVMAERVDDASLA
jgi:hypothetical protein